MLNAVAAGLGGVYLATRSVAVTALAAALAGVLAVASAVTGRRR